MTRFGRARESTREGDLAQGGAAPSVDALLGTDGRARWRGWAKWLAVALAAMALAVLIGRFVSGGMATRYAWVAVERGDLPLTLYGDGRLQPVGVRTIGADFAGTVRDVLVHDNDAVRSGQELARLDPAPFQDAIARAQALLSERESALDQALAQVRTAGDRLSLYLRVRRQSGGTVPSDRELADARSQADRANETVQAAQVEVTSARADLADRQAQLRRLAIRAPVDGVILQRKIEPGEAIAPGSAQPLFLLAPAASRLRLETAIDAGQARQLQQLGARTLLVSLPSGRSFRAAVTQVSPMPAPPQPVRSVAPNASRGPSLGMAFEIVNPGLALRPGTRVSLRIALGERRDVLIVPDEALRFARASDAARSPGQPGGEAVYVLGNDGAPHRVPVTTGGGDGRRTAVASDLLTAGMHVITGLE